MYHHAWRAGIGPHMVDAMTYEQLTMVLGEHRHPDYWLDDDDLLVKHGLAPSKDAQHGVPDAADQRAGKGARRRSGPAVRSTGGRQRIEANRELFAARRAAAKGLRPPVEAAPPDPATARRLAADLGG